MSLSFWTDSLGHLLSAARAGVALRARAVTAQANTHSADALADTRRRETKVLPIIPTPSSRCSRCQPRQPRRFSDYTRYPLDPPGSRKLRTLHPELRSEDLGGLRSAAEAPARTCCILWPRGPAPARNPFVRPIGSRLLRDLRHRESVLTTPLPQPPPQPSSPARRRGRDIMSRPLVTSLLQAHLGPAWCLLYSTVNSELVL